MFLVNERNRPVPSAPADDRLRRMLALHLHPRHGSTYWLRRQAEATIDFRDRIRCLDDLPILGPMPLDDLRRNSVRAFIPQRFHGEMHRFVTGETAGTSGQPCATAYRDDEFQRAFIDPFLKVARAAKFPQAVPWLWIGPSGPHIIGKVVRELARQTGSLDPFSVDFDPRWAKRLVDGSFARQRYLDHVVMQSLDVMEREEIRVLFTTPPALTALEQRMNVRQRESIRGIHYGGMCLTPEAVNRFREAFPNAVHLAGYGNTLFGVVMELHDSHRTSMDYFPLDAGRVVFRIVREGERGPLSAAGSGEVGRVMFHRFDESALLVNVLERDIAERIPASSTAKALGATTEGLRNPRPPVADTQPLQHGLY